jgi:putative toxin-antitoxin system antitoxin component (TIGR02293 family)
VLVDQIEKGLPFSTFAAFVRNSALPVAAAAQLVGLTARTLARRKVQKRLGPDESDRLIRAARLYAEAVELFEGNEFEARRWLSAPQPALGGVVPVKYAATEVGAREVASLIGRLEHGIPS